MCEVVNLVGFGARAKARFRVSGSVRCMGKKGLQFELGSGSDMRARARLPIRVMVMRE